MHHATYCSSGLPVPGTDPDGGASGLPITGVPTAAPAPALPITAPSMPALPAGSVPLEMGEAMRRSSSSCTPLVEPTRGIDMFASVSCTDATCASGLRFTAGDSGVCTGLGLLVCSDMAMGLRAPPAACAAAAAAAAWWPVEVCEAEPGALTLLLRTPSCSAYMTFRRWFECGGNSMPFSCAIAAAAASGVE